MNDFETNLRNSPSIEPCSKHRDTTVLRALEAFHKQQHRRPVVLSFFVPFFGAAAAVAIAAAFFTFKKEAPLAEVGKEEINRSVIVKAYRDLSETFPEGLAALGYIGGELVIYPERVVSHSRKPIYLDMMIGSTEIKLVASEGATIPVVIDGTTVNIEFISDASGETNILGEDFYWSAQAKFMPSGRKILKAEQIENLL